MGNTVNNGEAKGTVSVDTIYKIVSARHSLVEKKETCCIVFPKHLTTCIVVSLHRGKEVTVIYQVFLQKVPTDNEGRLQSTIALLDAINFKANRLGNFELDLADGEIRHKISFKNAKTEEQYSFDLLCQLEKSDAIVAGFMDFHKALISKSASMPDAPKEKEKEKEAFQARVSRGQAPVNVMESSNAEDPKPNLDPEYEAYIIPASSVTIDKKTELGKGAFGTVYPGEYGGCAVAVKQVQGPVGRDVLEEFKREFKVLMLLRHPNVLNCFGIVLKPLSIVTEFISGVTLFEFIHESEAFDALSSNGRIDLAIQLAHGMAYIHQRGVIHGDLKPLNVMVENNKTIKIIDFGLAKFKQVVTMTTARQRKPIETKANGCTLVYAAPELFTRDAMSKQSDVYAFGITFWEMTFQKTPYFDQGLFKLPEAEFAKKIANGSRPSIPSNDKKISNFLQSSWHTDPTERPSMDKIVSQLRELKTP